MTSFRAGPVQSRRYHLRVASVLVLGICAVCSCSAEQLLTGSGRQRCARRSTSARDLQVSIPQGPFEPLSQCRHVLCRTTQGPRCLPPCSTQLCGTCRGALVFALPRLCTRRGSVCRSSPMTVRVAIHFATSTLGSQSTDAACVNSGKVESAEEGLRETVVLQPSASFATCVVAAQWASAGRSYWFDGFTCSDWKLLPQPCWVPRCR